MDSAKKYMGIALEQARLAVAADEVPVGAVVVFNNEVIAAEHNRVEGLGDPTAHAEILAIRKAAAELGAWRLLDCTLYVTLEPCAMCAGAMVNARLGKLVFGAHEEKTGCCGSVLDLTDAMFLHTVESCGGVMEDECATLLNEYFEKKRNKGK